MESHKNLKPNQPTPGYKTITFYRTKAKNHTKTQTLFMHLEQQSPNDARTRSLESGARERTSDLDHIHNRNAWERPTTNRKRFHPKKSLSYNTFTSKFNFRTCIQYELQDRHHSYFEITKGTPNRISFY